MRVTLSVLFVLGVGQVLLVSARSVSFVFMWAIRQPMILIETALGGSFAHACVFISVLGGVVLVCVMLALSYGDSV